jgi:hypothetical protein
VIPAINRFMDMQRFSIDTIVKADIGYFASLKEFYLRKVHQLFFEYRKLPLKNTGDTLKGPDGTVLVTAHWVF